MVTSYIESNVKRTNRNLFLSNAVLLIGVVAVALLTSRYLYNVLSGPFVMDRQTLLNLKDVNNLDQYYVSLNGDQTLDTGVNEITTETTNGVTTSQQVSANYVALAFNQRLLLVRAPVNYTGTLFTGSLQPIPSDVQQGIVDKLVNQEPQLKNVFFPFMLNAADDFSTWGYVEMVAGVLLAGLAIWNLIKFLQRSTNPTAHPLYRTLAAYGPAESVVASVDAEATGPSAMRLGSTLITPHWLLHHSAFVVKAVRLDDLVWVYTKITQHRVYGIKTNKTYSIMMLTNQGRSIEIRAKNKQVTDIDSNVIQRAPWVLAGYTPERAKTWRASRQAMIKIVADRQHELRTQATQAASG